VILKRMHKRSPLLVCSTSSVYCLVSLLSPWSTHDPAEMDSRKWEAIYLSQPGPIFVVGQWETIVYCYRCACSALQTCKLKEHLRQCSVCYPALKILHEVYQSNLVNPVEDFWGSNHLFSTGEKPLSNLMNTVNSYVLTAPCFWLAR